ncbi:hypothetical protein PR202_ga31048 [Eleusine coracana subsp. coracana]|uniref:Cathepsin propeptide inhibitor domain-containing protein n=1 Tax=Eleusine coracana subsp. coracana TaxID=191504 RepID=A0AAV5DQX8_ELECO|nr:hypothetical protein PR202_ga31048 [Eleusine coracana subsp. coracana]
MKFKEQGLQNEDKLAKMFDDLMNTGEDHWNPSSGVAPSHSNAGEESTNNGGDEDEVDNEEDDDSEPEEVTPASAKGKKHAGKDTNKGTKPKTSGRQWSSDSEMEESDDKWRLKTLALMCSAQNNLFTTALEIGRNTTSIMAFPRAATSVFALILLSCFLMLAASSAAATTEGVDAAGDKLMMDRFLRWQVAYNRSYPSEEEKKRRLEVYRQNMEHIEATNQDGNLTYQLGENQFTDLTPEEFLDMYTMKGPMHDEKPINASFSDGTAVDAPTSVDWSPKAP